MSPSLVLVCVLKPSRQIRFSQTRAPVDATKIALSVYEGPVMSA